MNLRDERIRACLELALNFQFSPAHVEQKARGDRLRENMVH